MSDANEKPKRRYWIAAASGVLVVALVLLLVLWPRPRRERPEPAPFAYDVTYHRALFVELTYEQAFEELPAAVASGGDTEPAVGYVFRREVSKLFSYRGEKRVPRAPLYVGRRLMFSHARNPGSVSVLDAASEGKLTWRTESEPAPERLGALDVFSRVRLPCEITVERKGQQCVVSCQGKQTVLEAGKPYTIWTDRKDFSFEGYIASLRKLVPELPELDEFGRKQAQSYLMPDESGKVSVHARVTAVYHAEVHVADTDLRWLRRQARKASIAGEYEKALVLLRICGNFNPEDGSVWELLEWTRENQRQGVRMVRLSGLVSLPQELPRSEEPGWVAVRKEGDPPGRFRAVAELREGSYEMHVPAGGYNVRVSVPGYRVKTRNIELNTSKEWNVEYAKEDRQP